MRAIADVIPPTFSGALHGAFTGDPTFWVGVAQILAIDFLLSVDNAVIIAMACRGLPARQRYWGTVIGVTLAVLLRVVFAGIATELMELPYLKLFGGLALLYIAVKLLLQEKEPQGKDEVAAAANLWSAIRIVVVADVVMSIDNIIPVAAAARGNVLLLAIGLAGSIPLIIAGAAVAMSLLRRFPILIWLGAALLGWIAGDVISTDPVVVGYLTREFDQAVVHTVATVAGAVGAVLVVAAGAIARRFQTVEPGQGTGD